MKLNSSYEDETSVIVEKKAEIVLGNQEFPRQMVGLDELVLYQVDQLLMFE